MKVRRLLEPQSGILFEATAPSERLISVIHSLFTQAGKYSEVQSAAKL
jgi:hypothetical protein